MCGHGIIALTTGLIEEGLYPATAPATDDPLGDAGRARDGDRDHVRPRRTARLEVSRVRFVNVPSYLHAARPARPHRWRPVGALPRHGSLRPARVRRAPTTASSTRRTSACASCRSTIDALTRAGAAITDALRRDHTPRHPTDADLGLRVRDHHRRQRPGHLTGRTRARRHAPQRHDVRGRRGRSLALRLGHERTARAAARRSGASTSATRSSNAGITGEAFRGRVEGSTAARRPRWRSITSVEGTGVRDRLPHVRRRRARSAGGRLPAALTEARSPWRASAATDRPRSGFP